VSVARASKASKHLVAFAARPWMVPFVEDLGFVAFPAGSNRGLEPVTRPIREVHLDRERLDFRDGFGRRIARERAADLQPLCAAWRPDLIVWEETDFGAAIVAERLGLPHASVLVSGAGSFITSDMMAKALDEVRAEHDLPPDPEAEMLRRYLVLSPFPPSFRDPDYPLPLTAHGMRLVSGRAEKGGTGPAWATRWPAGPVVYFTLGTVFNHESGDLFMRVLAGLRLLPVNTLLTVGREIDPADLGPQPPSIRVERYVPQAEVLPHVHIVLSHGGSGTVLGALTFGRPMVLVPMGADQSLNAERCEALGVGEVLDAVRATPQDVADVVGAVLANPSFRRASERLRDEIGALPGTDHAVGLLERLALQKRPILTSEARL
jgi:UDP:flavonoid glycosyltransferase YjiC (YdhE family)